MKIMTRVIAFGVLSGLAIVANAQSLSPARTFAGELQQMQALSSTNPYAFGKAPIVPTAAQPRANHVPSFAREERRLQASSSANPYEFKRLPVLPATAADPVGKESFGNRFAQMQAESSNSGEFALQANATPRIGAASISGA